MGAPISEALKGKLRNQKKSMDSDLIIDNKNLTKIRIRLLPTGDEVPGKEYLSFYSDHLKKGSPSPVNFGIECLVLNELYRIRNAGTKEQRDFAKSFVSIQREYWLGCIDQASPGTANAVEAHILRGKRTVYEEIMTFMADDEEGENITDPHEGRDVRVAKEGAGKDNTKWTCKVLDRSPVSEDAAYVEAFKAVAANFNPVSHFYKVDLDNYAELYTGLTGNPIPVDYLERLND